MKDSTRRSLRTGFQALVSALVAVPTLAAFVHFPAGQAAELAAGIVAGAAIASKAINALEDAGVIPGWLYNKDASDEPQA
jgi:hypothetical protein